MQTCLSQPGHNGHLRGVVICGFAKLGIWVSFISQSRRSTLRVGGNENPSIVSFIMVQTQGRIPSCRQSRSTASLYGWMRLCWNVAAPIAAGVVFCGLPGLHGCRIDLAQTGPGSQFSKAGG